MGEELDLSTFPDSDRKTLSATLLQILASFLPFGSGAAGALLSALMPELNDDRIAWLEYVGSSLLQANERLDVHERRLYALDLDVLAQRSDFRAAIVRTTEIAVRDPMRRKWESLRNALLNIATGATPDEILQSIFLGNIQDLTALHLMFLDCIADTLAWAQRRGYPVHVGPKEADARAIFEGACRQELQPPGLHLVLLQDLYARGLAADDVNPDGFLSPSPELRHPHITELGKLFMAFVDSRGAGPGSPVAGHVA